jgi:tetratricopeptide (TPR) repeat protein
VLSTSEEFVTAAWNAYSQNDFAKAIELSQECIDRWESDAIKQQSAFTQAPSNGKVTDDEKKIIFANWALNDVGTAYFIKALSLEKLGKTADAKDAYNQVIALSYARCWDPQGFFWSPAEAASKNLAKLP